MTKTCSQCNASFDITQEDLEFYKKVSPVFKEKRYDIPAPSFCPDCRVQRRMSFRNFRNLYERKCDLTGKQIISMYAPTLPTGRAGEPFKVYDLPVWWSDKFDPLAYGRPFDFNKSFFEQMSALIQEVPKFSVFNSITENCLYSNAAVKSKNCYLVFGCVDNEDCYYGHIVWESKNCMDCLYVLGCELCYECLDCIKCYNLKFSQDCENCFDGTYLLDCKGCHNCFGCVGLRNKEYHIFNKPHSKEEYLRTIKSFDFSEPTQIQKVKSIVRSLALKHPFQYIHASNIEQCSGDYIYNSNNVHHGFDVKKSEDCKFAYTIKDFKDTQDINYSAGYPSELVYNSLTSNGSNILFCHLCTNVCENVMYCDCCFSSKNCFGCVGLKSKSYCILNKQYTKEEYEELVPRIIEYMIKTGEWGQFFPFSLSPFGYNETIASEYFPLEKEQALSLGSYWREDKEEASYYGATYNIPKNIADVPDDIINKILTCEVTGKYYKIIPHELQYYKTMKLPLPRRCPDQRHKDRMVLKNPRKLWDRKCMKCNIDITTSYSPERPEIVYCEKCSLETAY